ncbi:MAG: response regulator transcription factor [Bryobacter sp.]|jgi:DNA-binding NarL/FixJ family response regulator|nr:response regulator transcription factor [Bryobacter sp. CoA8 C33]
MTKVKIDASSPVVEAGLRALLEQQMGMQAARSGEIADVLLSDRRMEDIENEPRPMPVVLLTEEPSSGVLRRGVRGALRPNASPLEIRAALEAVAAGFLVLPAQDVEALAEPVDSRTQALLTSREREVLGLLAEGVGNKEIAWRLNITEHTVKFHVSSLMTKLKAGSRTEAVTQGIRRGFVAV